jgi:D-glycero-D-manno-heptose 1,7-bisphosphate phosphatase
MANFLRPAVLLDRDGTLIVDCGYLSDPQQIVLETGAVDGLRALMAANVALVVVTNQSGIGRRYFGISDAVQVNQRLAATLFEHGVVIEGWYICPHVPEDNCECRKPAPGLAHQAARELGLDLKSSWVVGDKPSDVMLAEEISAGGILVLTGEGSKHRDWAYTNGKTTCSTLVEAATHIAAKNPVAMSQWR